MQTGFEQDIPYIPVIIGFVIFFFLTTALQRKLRRRHFAQQGQISTEGRRVASIEERVAANRAWASGTIRCAGNWPMVILWILALVWNLTFGVAFINSFSNPEMTTGKLIVVGIFALLGIVPVIFAIRFTIQRFKFGNSWCHIDGKAGVLGKTLSGTVRTTTEIKPKDNFTFELQCIENYSTGSGKNRRSETILRHTDKQRVSNIGISSRAGVPFTFKLPIYPPETGCQLARGKISWNLKIHAALEGVDYAAMFVVPVFKMD